MEALVAPPQRVHGGNLHMEAPVAVVRLLSHIYAGYSAIINDCNFSYEGIRHKASPGYPLYYIYICICM